MEFKLGLLVIDSKLMGFLQIPDIASSLKPSSKA